METTNTSNQQEDKTVAVLCYMTMIGYVVAVILHGNNKTKIGSYHLKQASGLIVFSIALWMVMRIIFYIPILNLLLYVITPMAWLSIFVLLVFGIVSAANGQEKPLPIIGIISAKLFANVFN